MAKISSSVPGVPTGTPPLETVADANAASENGRPLATAETLVIAKGGNKGGRPRDDGLVPGSEEAKAADRDKDAKRKRNERAAARDAQLPPTLPSANASAPQSATVPTGPVAGDAIPPVDLWTAQDLVGVVDQGIPLAEAWRVREFTELCIEGKLPERVVQKIASDAKFPDISKQSLRASLPALLAKLFNQFRVPIAMKGCITAVPALGYLIVRDIQLKQEVREMIAEEAKRNQPARQPVTPRG